jgi:hypothetical protein
VAAVDAGERDARTATFFFQLKGARGVAHHTPRENLNDYAQRSAARALPL